MKGNMEERAEQLALYIIEHKTTVRAAAQKFGISKSTVHTVVLIGVDGIIALKLLNIPFLNQNSSNLFVTAKSKKR